MNQKTTHFGYQQVKEDEKSEKVAHVFDSVAQHYDLMNDLMSFGLHRFWKRFTINQAAVRPGDKVLDIAAGTGDLTREFARQATHQGQVWLTDINESMLRLGRDRLLDCGQIIPASLCNAEKLPFPQNYFDLVTVAFGLRNMTHKDRALIEMYRVLKPGGKLLILEFSKVWQPLQSIYDIYSFKILPRLGQMISGDAASYQYLAESIRVHPDQEALKLLLERVGFEKVQYWNLTMGVVALHQAIKFIE